jgi:hypothetical protein
MGGVDGETAEVSGDPSPARLLGNDGRGATAHETVEDKVAGVGGRGDDPLQESIGLLGPVAGPVLSLRVDRRDVLPEVVDDAAFGLVEIALQLWAFALVVGIPDATLGVERGHGFP